MNDQAHAVSIARTCRLKVRPESYSWLNAAAIEVNTVWNWANETSAKAARPFAGKPRWLSGFDLNNLSAGATDYFERIGADTIQRVRTSIICIAALLAAGTGGSASAQSLPAEALIDELTFAAASGVSLDQAVAMVEKRFNARVVRADVREERGRRVYVLRLLSDGSGRVWTVRVDAASGSLL